METPNAIDHYIANFPKPIQERLEQMRATIQKAAPNAVESINYGIPTFSLKGNLVHFGGYKNHIGFYPAPSAIQAFKKEVSGYEGAKGSIKFPLDQPLPIRLITSIVAFRVKENLEKATSKLKKTLRTCAKGHTYHKSSDCPTCPVCENERKPQAGFLSGLAAPARRALEQAGITTVKKLSRYSEAQLLQLHGLGPASLPKLKAILKEQGLVLKNS